MKRFAVAASDMSNAEQNAFVVFLQSKSMGWWHFINDFWLVTDPTNTVTADEIRDYLMNRHGAVRGIVLDVTQSPTWAGFAQTDVLKQTFDWLGPHWTYSP